ncbi:hypothetical protein SDC9_188826 [bioreactor metagenome]|uniref:Uncharacterized protein n=1 Tax=bioreactor metagenome TaxID=1076179 RepID=A0A645I193_9ZZZZ
MPELRIETECLVDEVGVGLAEQDVGVHLAADAHGAKRLLGQCLPDVLAAELRQVAHGRDAIGRDAPERTVSPELACPFQPVPAARKIGVGRLAVGHPGVEAGREVGIALFQFPEAPAQAVAAQLAFLPFDIGLVDCLVEFAVFLVPEELAPGLALVHLVGIAAAAKHEAKTDEGGESAESAGQRR